MPSATLSSSLLHVLSTANWQNLKTKLTNQVQQVGEVVAIARNSGSGVFYQWNDL